jgi:hypothetical protein
MLLFGDNGTAFWNAVVAIHTFWTVVLGTPSGRFNPPPMADTDILFLPRFIQ